jgi:ATP-binding cassette subfamily C (CFTR/MRP) protein 1
MYTVYMLVQVFVVAIYAFPYISLVIPLVFLISYCLIRRSTNALKETVLLLNTTKSPLLSYFGETINGTSTIRAFDKSEEFIKGCYVLLN